MEIKNVFTLVELIKEEDTAITPMVEGVFLLLQTN